MGLIPCPVPGKAKSRDLIAAFIAGAPKSARGYVFAGMMPGNVALWRSARVHPDGYWSIDNSSFDRARGLKFRITRNRMQHPGRGVSDCKRFLAMGYEIQPWVERDGPVVYVEQSAAFMDIVADDPKWLDIARGRNAHPHILRRWTSSKLEAASTLHKDLAVASRLVTHSSAAAVEAVLVGVPFTVSPMSSAWVFNDLPRLDRTQWAGVLADNEFTIEEMKSGEAWAWLNRE